MNRSADCLMDAGCLQAFAAEESPGTSSQQHKRSFSQTINLWYERSRQRRELLRLADDMTLLDDVGLSIYDIKREARKHFWNE